MMASRKQLKAVLASKVKNFGLISIAPKLCEFSLFNNFFLDLANFWDLNNFSPFKFYDLDKFWLFNFLNFLVIFSLLSISNSSTLLSPIPSHLGVNFFDNIVVFSIEMSRITILLKP